MDPSVGMLVVVIFPLTAPPWVTAPPRTTPSVAAIVAAPSPTTTTPLGVFVHIGSTSGQGARSTKGFNSSDSRPSRGIELRGWAGTRECCGRDL